MHSMEPAASAFHRITLAIAGLALAAALAGYGAPKVALVDRIIPTAPGTGPLTISSPAFADGAPIPVLYTCKGTDTSPPLNWSAPLGGALVVDDPDAPGGTYIHWIVIGIAPGSGQVVEGGTPGGGVSLPNSLGQAVYNGPCPPPGSGVHHYRFTLYQLPNDYQLPGGLAGPQAAQTIAAAANAHAQLVGTFGS
jgi:Raf kinase inhibitor-like YbhB/YbcL family protein